MASCPQQPLHSLLPLTSTARSQNHPLLWSLYIRRRHNRRQELKRSTSPHHTSRRRMSYPREGYRWHPTSTPRSQSYLLLLNLYIRLRHSRRRELKRSNLHNQRYCRRMSYPRGGYRWRTTSTPRSCKYLLLLNLYIRLRQNRRRK